MAVLFIVIPQPSLIRDAQCCRDVSVFRAESGDGARVEINPERCCCQCPARENPIDTERQRGYLSSPCSTQVAGFFQVSSRKLPQFEIKRNLFAGKAGNGARKREEISLDIE